MGERTTSEWRIRVFMGCERHQRDQQELKETQGTKRLKSNQNRDPNTHILNTLCTLYIRIEYEPKHPMNSLNTCREIKSDRSTQ